jgi:hypothetical protein
MLLTLSSERSRRVLLVSRAYSTLVLERSTGVTCENLQMTRWNWYDGGGEFNAAGTGAAVMLRSQSC